MTTESVGTLTLAGLGGEAAMPQASVKFPGSGDDMKSCPEHSLYCAINSAADQWALDYRAQMKVLPAGDIALDAVARLAATTVMMYPPERQSQALSSICERMARHTAARQACCQTSR